MTTDSATNAAEKPMSIRECLDAVHKAGGDAWDKVADPDGFIRWMRGSDDPKDVAAAEQAMQSMPMQSPASAPEQANIHSSTPPPTANDGGNSARVDDRAPRPVGEAGPASMSELGILENGNWTNRPAHEFIEERLAAALSPRPSDVREQQAHIKLLNNIQTCARMGLSFGRQATPQTPERMIQRRDEALNQIVKFCEQGGGQAPSILREQQAEQPDSDASAKDDEQHREHPSADMQTALHDPVGEAGSTSEQQQAGHGRRQGHSALRFNKDGELEKFDPNPQAEQGDGGTSERITVNPCDPTENPVILPGDKIRDRRDTTGTLWRVLARIDAGLSNMIKLGKVDGDEVRWVPSREIVGHCDLVVPYGVPAPGEIVGSPSVALTQPPRSSSTKENRL